MGGGRWKRAAASGSGLILDAYAGTGRAAGTSARMRRASRGACCLASVHQTISAAVTTRTDGTAACVESNASSAANTYCATARAICLSVSRKSRAAQGSHPWGGQYWPQAAFQAATVGARARPLVIPGVAAGREPIDMLSSHRATMAFRPADPSHSTESQERVSKIDPSHNPGGRTRPAIAP